MGFNTALVVLNDMLHDIEQDPFFGRKVAEAVRSVHRPGDKNWDNSFTVLPSQHADYNQLVVVGGNMIQRFEDIKAEERDALLKRLARNAGYRLSRLPSTPNVG